MSASSPPSGFRAPPLPVAPLSRTAAAVVPAIEAAARRTGVSFDALFNTARVESGFDAQARARTSSATGLFQFTEGTWLSTLGRHGQRLGLSAAGREEALALRKDPAAASLMAAAHMADNAEVLAARTGRQPGQVELYLAHFLGAGGASQFLARMADAPDTSAADMMPVAARANRGVFYTGGRARSLAEVYDLFARKLGGEPAPGAGRREAYATAPSSSDAGPAPGASPASADLPQAQALHSARLAYLLLADLGA